MIDGSKKRNCQLAFELQRSRASENRNNAQYLRSKGRFVSFYLPQKRLLYPSLVYFHSPFQVASHSLNKTKEHSVLLYNLWIAELQLAKQESGKPKVRNLVKPSSQENLVVS